MKITLEVLKEKGASERDIQCFEKFCLYENKTEFEPVELLKYELLRDNFDTGMSLEDFDYIVAYDFDYYLVHESVDTLQEVRDIVDYYRYNSNFVWIYDTLKFHHEIYKQDLDFCKETMHVYLSNIDSCMQHMRTLYHCSKVLEMLPELHEKLKNYVESKVALDKEVEKIFIKNT